MCTSLTDLQVHSGNTDKRIESYRQRESEAAAMAKGLCALGNPGNKIEPSLAPLEVPLQEARAPLLLH